MRFFTKGRHPSFNVSSFITYYIIYSRHLRSISTLSETKCWIVQLTQLKMLGHNHCSEPAIQMSVTTTTTTTTHLLALTVVIIASLGQSLAGTFPDLGHLAQGLVTNPSVRNRLLYISSQCHMNIALQILIVIGLNLSTII